MCRTTSTPSTVLPVAAYGSFRFSSHTVILLDPDSSSVPDTASFPARNVLAYQSMSSSTSGTSSRTAVFEFRLTTTN